MKLSLQLLIDLLFLLNSLFKLFFHLFLSKLHFLSVFVNKLSHSLNLIISVNNQVLILYL